MLSDGLCVKWGLVCLAIVACASGASAQQSIFSNKITVTATGSEQVVEEIPLPVTVIDRNEIDEAQQESVADLLRRVPGLDVVRSGDKGSITSVFTRGTDSDHTLALFDGVRLNSPYFAGYDWSLLPTAGLDRIEVARGPFSALWGADAIGGVVNVIPARAGDGLSATIFGEGGDDDWRRIEATVGWSGDGFDLYASGFDRQGEGELENSDFSNRQLLLNAGWTWGAGNRLSVVVQDLESDVGVPFANPEAPTPNHRDMSYQRLIAVPVQLRVRDGWDLQFVASQVERELVYRDPDDPWGFTASDTLADTLQAKLVSRHNLGDHDISWGGEWREDEVSNETSYGVNLDGDTSSVTSLFVQDVWQATEDFRLIGGVRWDDAEEWGSEVSPRVSLGWSVGGGVDLIVGYGSAFRQPSVGELYYPYSGNPELEAETSDSIEAGVTWFSDRGRIQFNLFATRVDNLIEFDFPTYGFANISEATMRGIEFAWDVPINAGLLSSLQGTWLDTEDAEGEMLLRRPTWRGSWTLRGTLWKRLRGDLTVIWVGSRDDIDPITFERISMEDHVTGDLAMGFEVLPGMELTLRIQNVTDTRYQEVAGYPAPGRRFSGGLRWKL